ncbi:SDR family oxidoreductase [Paenibacillus yanchengensis]|uniref:SDR family oxidoreductase n=1 Tax=Paenibacillus yanchengensis TaxID=2035833 RepID=A0ABW4YG73_9BACL
MKLENKVAIVTGAASGMGKSIAKLYAAEGAKVVVADLAIEAAEVVVQEIVAAGGDALAVSANVAKEEDVKQLVDRTVEQYGTLDILVNNAGIMDSFLTAEEVTDEMWDRVIAVNTTGPMRTIRKALPIFTAKSNGVIINIASAGGLFGSRAGIAYTASKHAVVGMTKNVGFQYAGQGIRCNAIAPGGVKTNIGASMGNVSQVGMGHMQKGAALMTSTGEPEDIAALALFLASDEASFINGTVITADGAWTAY